MKNSFKKNKRKEKYKIGLVKWYGGYNYKKDCKNDFGFLEIMSGDELFFHKKSIQNFDEDYMEKELHENKLVLYIEDKKRNASFKTIFIDRIENLEDFNLLIESLEPEEVIEGVKKGKFLYQIKKAFERNTLNIINSKRFKSIKDISRFNFIINDNPEYINFLIEEEKISVKDYMNTGLDIAHLGEKELNENIKEVAKKLKDLPEEHVKQQIKQANKILTFDSVVYLIVKGYVTPDYFHNNTLNKKDIFTQKKEFDFYFENMFLKGFTFVNAKSFIIDEIKSTDKGELLRNPFFTDFCLKRKIYKHDMSFINDLESLNNQLTSEYYILSKLIPLLSSNNSFDLIEDIIKEELWEGLKNGDIKPDDESLFNLFPRCETMKKYDWSTEKKKNKYHTYRNYDNKKNLSCEAIHWHPPTLEKKRKQKEGESNDSYEEYLIEYEKKEHDYINGIYLCRKKRCFNPKVLPSINNNYFHFTIYDWFKHYGVMYGIENKPSQNDFPIKLAGFLNRLREIYEKAHCNQCGLLLDYKKNQFTKKEVTFFNSLTKENDVKVITASYRITLFHCNNPDCSSYHEGIYINHCVNYKCNKIIDSRDNVEKCSSNKYVCNCGACCRDHQHEWQ